MTTKQGRKHQAQPLAEQLVIFNLMLILGVSSSIHPFGVNMASACDMLIQIGVILLTYIFAATGKGINRGKGLLMLLIYVADIVFAAIR